jgi:hypothetical protein
MYCADFIEFTPMRALPISLAVTLGRIAAGSPPGGD